MKVRTVLGDLIHIDPRLVEAKHLSTCSMYWFEGVRLLPTPSEEIQLMAAQLRLRK